MVDSLTFKNCLEGWVKIKMIKIEIQVKDGKIYDSFHARESTLNENSLAVRRLEEIKLELLNIEYKDDLLIEQDED